jgi:alpha-1,3-glucosyltransferase
MKPSSHLIKGVVLLLNKGVAKMDPAIMIFLLSACIKVLLFPAYKSTDFEVHRNWLAITHSLPLSKWYYESTSQWTLDYPPLFAWFEWLMSHFAYLIDPAIVQLSNLEYTSASCVYFQRCSVIFTEIVLCYAVIEFCKYKESSSVERLSLLKTILSFQLLANFGLLIVDHIHFQYNGFLFGILILSITRILQGRHIEGAMWFAVLLNLKHIFLYIAPAYFIYLLKHYCFNDHSNQSSVTVGPPSLNQFKVKKFTWLGVSVVTIFFASFGPFIINGQLGQVISRLFPFKRGLCHAYWAPNIWAIYNIIDKMSATTGNITTNSIPLVYDCFS